MAAPNPLRGEGEIGGRKLVVDFNSLCALEAVTGYKVPDLLALAETGLGFHELRTWFGVFLVDDLSPKEVGDLVGAEIAAADGEKFMDRMKVVQMKLSVPIEGFFGPPQETGGDPPPAE
jgi:hypothetical protein